MSRRLAYSRWRRLPGVFRSGERRQVGPGEDPERLTLYLPARVLDLATELAAGAGAPTMQAFCEALLRRAIEAAADDAATPGRPRPDDARGAPFEGLDAIANDPDYLAEWSQSRASRELEGDLDHDSDFDSAFPSGPAPAPAPDEEDGRMNPFDEEDGPGPAGEPAAVTIPRAVAVEIRLDELEEPFRRVLHHAALAGEPPPAALASLRAGIAVEPDAARELVEALETLVDRLRGVPALDRRLAFALHRLTLESQILLTETWPGLANDPLQVEVLRRVQDLVDRLFADAEPDAHADAAPAPQE
jgi:hypothetical protein